MRRLLLWLALPLTFVVVAIGLSTAHAQATADRTLTFGQLIIKLNGTPTRLGVLTSAGTSVTPASTAVTFSVPAGSLLKLECSATAHINAGASASTDITNAAYGDRVSSYEDYYLLLGDGASALAMIPSSGAASCIVWRMQ